MAAGINDKITKVSSGVRPVSTTVSTIRNSGATTLACADLTGWTTTEIVFFVTYKVDGQGDVVAGSQSDWKGLVSGTNINSLTLTGGADAGNAPGDTVEMLPTSEYAKKLAENILAHANQDGSLIPLAVTTAITASPITSTQVANDAVTPAKRSGGFAIGVIASSVFSSTGIKTISGLGFTPKMVHFTILPSASTTAAVSGSGGITTTNQFFHFSSSSAGNTARDSGTTNCIVIRSSGTNTPLCTAAYSSMNSDGFAINVTTAAAVYDVSYEAYA